MTRKTADDYYYEDREAYEEPETFGFTTIPVLDLLVGSAWNDDALNVVRAARPSSIRVVHATTKDGVLKAETTSTSELWRLTITVDEQKIIRAIVQEVEVGIYGRRDGNDVRAQLMKGGEKAECPVCFPPILASDGRNEAFLRGVVTGAMTEDAVLQRLLLGPRTCAKHRVVLEQAVAIMRTMQIPKPEPTLIIKPKIIGPRS
jgi:hypothetical protein